MVCVQKITCLSFFDGVHLERPVSEIVIDLLIRSRTFLDKKMKTSNRFFSLRLNILLEGCDITNRIVRVYLDRQQFAR